ncbi:flavin reductase family protein [Ahrensia marina]|uniref:flavin reductase family protein n=1 Tax=Ahrensia marina TaxID=1514904 RepID=UPI0006B4A7BE|nr:iron-sulfur cluster-binding domain-containing protein [Ahrensia marina]
MITANPWAPQRKRTWLSDRWGSLACKAVWDETSDVRTFLLAPVDGARIAHTPGQYMTFRIEDGDALAFERCYTIASSAARDGAIEVTIKRQQDGLGSSLMHDQLTVGKTIEAFGPSGQFCPVDDVEARYALIAAGSGVTPMLSILRTAADRGIELDAIFIHVARTVEDAIAVDELPILQRRIPKLVYSVLPSQGADKFRLTGDVLLRMVPDLADRTVLCCGPTSFMDMVWETSQSAGVALENYFQESFDFASGLEAEEVSEDAPLRRITFVKSGVSFDCPEGVNILRAAKDAGVAMPSSCSKGECGTCKTFKHSGEVNMQNEGGIRQREIDRGFILPCVSRPLTDIALDR